MSGSVEVLMIQFSGEDQSIHVWINMPIITAGGADLVAKFELRKKVRRVRTFINKKQKSAI